MSHKLVMVIVAEAQVAIQSRWGKHSDHHGLYGMTLMVGWVVVNVTLT